MTLSSLSQGVLVTGGAGFIGSHTVDALLHDNIPVTVLDNLSTGKLSNLNLKSRKLRFIEGDILDYPRVQEALKGCAAVLHLTALPSVPRSIEDPVYSHAVNTQGFLHILQAIYEARRPIRLVYASSSAVYGNSLMLPCCDEQTLHSDVLSPYALQKVHNEQYASLYDRLFELPALALRYFNVYGSRQDPKSPYSGVISLFLDRYGQGLPLTVYGDGNQSRDFIHIDDVVRANYLALSGNYSGVLNIATGVPQTLNHLLSFIEETGGQKAEVSYTAARLGDIEASYAAIHKAKQFLGFHHTIALRDGIRQLMSEEIRMKYAKN